VNTIVVVTGDDKELFSTPVMNFMAGGLNQLDGAFSESERITERLSGDYSGPPYGPLVLFNLDETKVTALREQWTARGGEWVELAAGNNSPDFRSEFLKATK
jgi:hypothetical protein